MLQEAPRGARAVLSRTETTGPGTKKVAGASIPMLSHQQVAPTHCCILKALRPPPFVRCCVPAQERPAFKDLRGRMQEMAMNVELLDQWEEQAGMEVRQA